MNKNIILGIVLVFIIAVVASVFANQILWPYLVERPLFYKYRLEERPIVINKTEDITIDESAATEKAVEKIDQSVIGLKTEKESSGSGVVITSDGLAITFSNLVSDKGTIAIANGTSVPFHVVKRDNEANLVLIKIEKTGLLPVSFAEFGSLRFGQKVFLEGVVFNESSFYKSANEGVIKTYNDYNIETNILEDKPLSGSPLFNIKGELMGLIMISKDNNVSAIPINRIHSFLGF